MPSEQVLQPSSSTTPTQIQRDAQPPEFPHDISVSKRPSLRTDPPDETPAELLSARDVKNEFVLVGADVDRVDKQPSSKTDPSDKTPAELKNEFVLVDVDVGADWVDVNSCTQFDKEFLTHFEEFYRDFSGKIDDILKELNKARNGKEMFDMLAKKIEAVMSELPSKEKRNTLSQNVTCFMPLLPKDSHMKLEMLNYVMQTPLLERSQLLTHVYVDIIEMANKDSLLRDVIIKALIEKCGCARGDAEEILCGRSSGIGMSMIYSPGRGEDGFASVALLCARYSLLEGFAGSSSYRLAIMYRRCLMEQETKQNRRLLTDAFENEIGYDQYRSPTAGGEFFQALPLLDYYYDTAEKCALDLILHNGCLIFDQLKSQSSSSSSPSKSSSSG
jgi:hypothetical protein